MIKKFLFSILFLLSSFLLSAQVTDDFNDGDFTTGTVWSGDASSYTVVTGQLRSNSSVASSKFYLSTPSTYSVNCQWEIYVNLQFNTSSLNYFDYFLQSDNANLNASLNGYFVRVGGTSDEISLYRRTGLTNTLLIDGINGSTNKSNNTVLLKIKRTAASLWTLERDTTGTGTSYVTEGSTTDATFTSSSFMGVFVEQSTATFFLKHFFDNVYAGPVITDVVPPAISSLNALSSTQLDVQFSEPVDLTTSQTVSNYSVSGPPGTPATAVRDGADNKIVHLTFVSSFTPFAVASLTVNNVQDLAANPISPGSLATFTYVPPAGFRDVLINEIFADPSPVVGLPAFEFIELFNRTPAAINVGSWTITHGGTVRTLPSVVLPADSFLVLVAPSALTDYLPYGNVASVTSLSTSALINTGTSLVLKNNLGVKIDSLFYSDSWYRDAVKDDGGWSLELINPNFPLSCPTERNWIASADPNGGTPGKKNSVYSTAPDITPPGIVSVKSVTASSVQVCFSEPLDAALISTPSNYSLSGGFGVPATAVPDPTGSCVTLTFAGTFTSPTSYTLSFSGLADCSGNSLTGGPSGFFYYVPKMFDVVIHEIMADPTPLVGSPDREYAEIFNRTPYPIVLDGWQLIHGTTTKTITSATLPASGYLLLTSPGGLGDFSAIGSYIVEIPGLSTSAFTNTGTLLQLNDAAGNFIHSVSYSDTWYGDPLKADGGWSLEMIDASNPCSGSANWKASASVTGGTPAAVNSVKASNPDASAPRLQSVLPESATQLLVYFSEPVVGTALSLVSAYSVSGGVGSPSAVSVLPLSSSSVRLTLPVALVPTTVYTLTVSSGLTDCVGNPLGTASMPFARRNAALFDIVINEIMADPEPAVGLPNGEYLELYNRSSFPINLYKFKLKIGSTEKQFGSAMILPGQYLTVIPPADESKWTSVPGAVSIPSLSQSFLTNSGTSLVLSDSTGKEIHTVNYSDRWYQNPFKTDGGWSLEMVDVNNPCGEMTNWKASLDVKGGTPGKVNSVAASNPDIIAPKIRDVCVSGSKTVEVFFDEIIRPESFVAADFSVDGGMGAPVNAVAVLPASRSVMLEFSSPFRTSVLYTLSVSSSVKDCLGNALSSGTFKFSLQPVKPFDVVMTEIMADPDPVVLLPSAEYIELYNRLDRPVSLKDWKISSGTTSRTLPCASIGAGERLLLCHPDKEQELSAYGKTIGVEGFPGITNDGTTLSLTDAAGNVIHALSFDLLWYADANKDDGGWSLEMIDPLNPCGGKENWRASKDSRGGTPATSNSVGASLPDAKRPYAVRALVTGDKKVQVFFSENMSRDFLLDSTRFIADQGLGSPVYVYAFPPLFNRVELTFASPVVPGVIYSLTVSTSLSDCAGNLIDADRSLRFAVASPVQPGDVKINEILSDPNEGGVDFVELVNTAPYPVDLKEMRLTSFDSSLAAIETMRVIDSVGYLLFPGEYVVLSKNAEQVRKFYFTPNPDWFIDMESMPSFNIGSGNAVLVAWDQRVIDEMGYDEAMHYPLLQSSKGVSLERLSLSRPASERTNWHSASSLVGYATPAYKNSQATEEVPLDGEITVFPEVFSPDNDGFDDVVQFAYRLEKPGYLANVTVYDARGRKIRQLAANELLGTSGVWVWDGVSGDGEKSAVGVYVVLFELTGTDGKVRKIKKTCVLGSRL